MPKSVLRASKRLKRKRLFLRFFLILFLAVFFLGGISVSVFFIERLKIKEVVINDTKNVKKEEVLSYINEILKKKDFYFIPRDRIFTFPNELLSQQVLSRFKTIERLSLDVGLDQVARVYVYERLPAALFCEEDGKSCLFLDKSGFIFDPAPYFSDGVFVKFEDFREEKADLWSYVFETGEYKRIMDFIDLLAPEFSVLKVKIKNMGVYELYTKDGWYIILESRDDWSVAYDNFVFSVSEILDEKKNKIEYIDLRFGNKVFFK